MIFSRYWSAIAEKTFGELAFAEQAEFSHRKEALVKFLDAAAEEFSQEEDATR